MNPEEMIEIVDRIILKNTEKHLTDLQEEIIKGTLAKKKKKYGEIAKENHVTDDHVRKVAYELWHQLSEFLGTNVHKSNLKSTIESIYNSNSFIQNGENNQINYCPNTSHNQDNNQNNRVKPQECLAQMPKIANVFYGREEELTTMKYSIINNECQLLTVLGVKGIGKTHLTVKLVEEIKDNFDYVFWYNLSLLPIISQIQTKIINFISQSENSNYQPDKTKHQLQDYFIKYRCLIIFDNVEALFTEGELAGNYRVGYQNYRQLFNKIAEINHQSCLILISQELPLGIINLLEENQDCILLYLTGLKEKARHIFEAKQLLDEDKGMN